MFTAPRVVETTVFATIPNRMRGKTNKVHFRLELNSLSKILKNQYFPEVAFSLEPTIR
jgi:hypothetical protein